MLIKKLLALGRLKASSEAQFYEMKSKEENEKTQKLKKKY